MFRIGRDYEVITRKHFDDPTRDYEIITRNTSTTHRSVSGRECFRIIGVENEGVRKK